MKLFSAKTLSVIGLLSPLYALSQELTPANIEILEKFITAKDRAPILQTLAPGTELSYYLHAVDAQLRGDDKVFADIMGRFAKAFPHSDLHRRLALRQDLAKAPSDAKAAERLRQELGLRTDYPRPEQAQDRKLPTSLSDKDTDAIGHLRQFVAANDDLSALSPEGRMQVVRLGLPLKPEQRRQLARTIQWMPDNAWIDLLAQESQGKEALRFGAVEAHRNLLLGQMDALAAKVPDIAVQREFLLQRLQRLIPADAGLWPRDPAAEASWLRTQWTWISKLPPRLNDLKAGHASRLLTVERQLGTCDKDLFLAYLALPRPCFWIQPERLAQARETGQAFGGPALIRQGTPPLHDDKLVRELLAHFLAGATDVKDFAPLVREDVLRRAWAEANLLKGLGDERQWVAMLDPETLNALRNRVDIDFAPETPFTWKTADTPVLPLDLKNADRLLVRTYDINTREFARLRGGEVPADIDLDGLQANSEQVLTYTQAPMLRHRESIKLDALAGKRGVWVVELIANGRASRAVVRKGALAALAETGDTGHRITIVDESGAPVPNAELRQGTRVFKADASGSVLLPFSTLDPAPGQPPMPIAPRNDDGGAPRTVRCILADSATGFSQSVDLALAPEQRELSIPALIPSDLSQVGAQGKLVVTPTLHVNGQSALFPPAAPLTLTVTAITATGEAASQAITVKPEALGKAMEVPFTIPEGLAAIRIKGQMRLPRTSRTGFDDLGSEQTYPVAGASNSMGSAEAFLRRDGADWLLDLRGRNGEALASKEVTVRTHSRYLEYPREFTLRSDADGRIRLDSLNDIERLNVTFAQDGTSQTLGFRIDSITKGAGMPWEAPDLAVTAGKPLVLPCDTTKGVHLHEIRGGAPATDRADALKPGDRSVRIEGLKAGEYCLVDDLGDAIASITVTGETARDGWGLDRGTATRLSERLPSGLGSWRENGANLELAVVNPRPDTRVIVTADAFVYANAPAPKPDNERLLMPQGPESVDYDTPFSTYLSGRVLAEEFRYVLERRFLKPQAGVMLPKPGVILAPWERDVALTEVREAQAGRGFTQTLAAPAKPDAARKNKIARAKPMVAPAAAGMERSANKSIAMDMEADASGYGEVSCAPAEDRGQRASFLKEAARTWVLTPDAQGIVRLPTAQLAGRNWVVANILESSPTHVATHATALATPQLADRRQAAPDASGSPRGVRRESLSVAAGKAVPSTPAQGRQRAVRTFDEAFGILADAVHGSGLSDWGFLRSWSRLDEAAKLDHCKRFASHELTLFIWNHDRAFFDAHLKPLLANKRMPQLVDDFVLGRDLTPWIEPARFATLNAVERALLARRLPAQRDAIATAITQFAKANPVPPAERDRRFKIALGESQQDDTTTATIAPSPGMAEGLADYGGVAPMTPMPAAAPMAAMKAERFEAKGGADKGDFYYEAPALTKELAESQWHKLRLEDQGSGLFRNDLAWAELAATDADAPWLPANLLDTAHDTRSAVVALAILGLADDPAKPAGAIVFRQQDAPLAKAPADREIAVNQVFFNPESVRRDDLQAVAPDAFEAGKTYGVQVVVSNPTNARREVILQVPVPEGAIAVDAPAQVRGNLPDTCPPTNSWSATVTLRPFEVRRFIQTFYFPKAGEFAAAGAAVSGDDTLAGAAAMQRISVKPAGSVADRTSWQWIAARGTEDEVIKYLASADMARTDLAPMLWRLADRKFYERCQKALAARLWFDKRVGAFALRHGDFATLASYIKTDKGLAARIGAFRSPWLDIDPERERFFEAFEYEPLVNARVMQLGEHREILNGKFRDTYGRFVSSLVVAGEPSPEQLLLLSTYLLLQDRTPEAADIYARIPRDKVAEKLQLDYLGAWLALAQGDVAKAKALATPHAQVPSQHWRERFAKTLAQIQEIETGKPTGNDAKSFSQDAAAGLEQTVAAQAEGETLVIRSRGFGNAATATLAWYPMDIEFLFSASPFLSAPAERFALIQPQLTTTQALSRDGVDRIALPAELKGKNVLVEVRAGDKRASIALLANRLDIGVAANYGQVLVRERDTGAPQPRTYVKVFARHKDGRITFHKDGYTDLRGRFDYAGISTGSLATIERFSILVNHDTLGAEVRETPPPAQ